MSGYRQNGFAESLGTGLYLENVKGSVLRRKIGTTGTHDVVNPYPVFACSNFANFEDDLTSLRVEGAIALTVRTDAFDEMNVLSTRDIWDWFKPFKTHFITDLTEPWRDTAARNAKRYEKRAREDFEFSLVSSPSEYAADLARLNEIILNRTQINKSAGLSVKTLEKQLNLRGVRLFKAEDSQGPQGLALFMKTDRKAYAYLLGATDEARSKHVIYGLYGYALDALSAEVDAVDFGGNPGPTDDLSNSVGLFKQLWTNRTATSYICGKIFNPEAYGKLCKDRPALSPNYFPAYRAL